MGTLQVKGFPAAVSLLTRLRVREAVEGRGDLARSVPWFPVVGAILGLGVAGVYAAARLALPSLAAAVGLLGWVSPATEEGLGAAYSASASRRLARWAGAVGLVIGLGSLGAWVLPAALLVSLGAAGVGRLGVRNMSGVTGDLLGAAQQAGEVLVLLLGAAAISNGWPGLPWWR